MISIFAVYKYILCVMILLHSSTGSGINSNYGNNYDGRSFFQWHYPLRTIKRTIKKRGLQAVSQRACIFGVLTFLQLTKMV